LSLQGALRLAHKGQGFLQLLPEFGRQERHQWQETLHLLLQRLGIIANSALVLPEFAQLTALAGGQHGLAVLR
jgi:hypothetical protein